MQTFFNSATGKYHQYEEDVTVDPPTGTWSTSSGVKGTCPTTLVPYTGTWPIPPTLNQAKVAQITLLQASYQSAVNAPVTFKNAAGVTSTYPSGNTVLINGMRAKDLLAEVIAAGEAAWTLGKWLDTNNVAQTFTFADLQGLAAAMEASITLDWTDLIAKIDEVNNATSVAAVQTITF